MLIKLAHLHGQFLSWPTFRNASYVAALLDHVRVDTEDFFGNVIRRYVILHQQANCSSHKPLFFFATAPYKTQKSENL